MIVMVRLWEVVVVAVVYMAAVVPLGITQEGTRNFTPSTELYFSLTTEQPGNITTNVPGNVTTKHGNSTEPYNFTTIEPPSNTTTSQPGNITTNVHVPGNMTTMPGNSTEPPYNFTTVEPPSNMTTSQPGNITTNVPGNMTTMPGNSTKPPFNFTTVEPSNMTTKQPGNITTNVPGNITTISGNYTEPPLNLTTPTLPGNATDNSTTTELINATSQFPVMPTTAASNLPKDETPKFKGKPKKVIRIEVAISEDSTQCRPAKNNTSSYCQALGKYFFKRAEVYYRNIQGFQTVRLADEMRKGSVIIPHEVVYDYVGMRPQDEGLSAMEVYQRTLAPAVAMGKLGNLNVLINCSDCSEPEDETNFCNFTKNGLASCQNPYLELQCVDGYVKCRSPCKATHADYCNDHGVCSQADNANPTCRCSDSSSEWYHGDRCRYSTSKVGVIGGVSAVLVLFIVLVYAAVYWCKKRSNKRRSWNLLSNENDDEDDYDSEEDVDGFARGPKDPATLSGARSDPPPDDEGGKYTYLEMEHP